jgi:hypothetical protein
MWEIQSNQGSYKILKKDHFESHISKKPFHYPCSLILCHATSKKKKRFQDVTGHYSNQIEKKRHEDYQLLILFIMKW